MEHLLHISDWTPVVDKISLTSNPLEMSNS